MKLPALLFVAVILCFFACSTFKDHNLGNGNYSGLVILFSPLALPNDSVGTPMTLTLTGNRFSGTSDTTKSAISPVIGGGTYLVKSGHITFTQDSIFLLQNATRSVLDGQYDLLTTGDSLVFARIPAAGLIGAGSAYFRLRAN